MSRGYFTSLRGRYAVIAVLLAVLVLAGALIGHRIVNSTRQEIAENLEARSQPLQTSRHLRDALWQGYKSLDAFLLDPLQTGPRAHIHASLAQAMQFTDTLAHDSWVRGKGQDKTIAAMKQSLSMLDAATQQLIATRLDSTRQYPALTIANRAMAPYRDLFDNAVTVALEEVKADADFAAQLDVFQGFTRLRYLWTQMISNSRLYLANRLGSFDERALPVQERAVATQYQDLKERLAELKALDRRGALGFQSGAALADMERALVGWYNGFLEVRRIHASGEWRADAKLIKETIDPRLEEIWAMLQSLDVAIENNAAADVDALARAAQLQTSIFWTVVGFGLLIIAVGYIALVRWLIRPIATVAEALNAEAHGAEGLPLPQVSSQETRVLVDAFAGMRKQVHSRQLALEYQAMHDMLTGLGNRALLLDRIAQAIQASGREPGHLAVLMLDLDRFKEINDTLGHHVGDRLLREIGARLSATLRPVDTIARLGGDEFAVLLTDTNEGQALAAIRKLHHALEQRFDIDGHHLSAGASIGIAVYPTHGNDPLTLVQRADVAMYVAKRNKIGQFVYDEREDNHNIGRLALMTDLREALTLGKLTLHYQPKIDLAANAVIGVEALLRWHHPQRGSVPPDEIIPLAEQTSLIQPLTSWVLNEVVRQCQQWRTSGLHLPVAINLSMYNLQDATLVTQVRACLEAYALPFEYLTLEITESAMMANPASVMETLSALDNMGVRLVIDDFGAGFSSLAYLKQLPVQELKIDKTFVMGMSKDDDDAIIVRSTIDLAHNLGLRVVAEGIEDETSLHMLRGLRCDAGQGYYLSHPITAEGLEKWLRGRSSIAAGAVNSGGAMSGFPV